MRGVGDWIPRRSGGAVAASYTWSQGVRKTSSGSLDHVLAWRPTIMARADQQTPVGVLLNDARGMAALRQSLPRLFRAAAGEIVRVGGFYDGDGRYVIRFLPPSTGIWRSVPGRRAAPWTGSRVKSRSRNLASTAPYAPTAATSRTPTDHRSSRWGRPFTPGRIRRPHGKNSRWRP
ncbi:DUF5060 domain-containing protein [Streptomyces sp. NPDC002643]